MKFRKLAVGLSVIALANAGAPTIKVFANEFNNSSLKIERTQEHTSSMKKFDIESKENFNQYKEKFKIQNELIESVSANGGNYVSSTPEKAIDEDIRTHWETGTANSESFTNEFTVTFKDIVSTNKMTYKVRQDSGTKGFLNNYEIYASKTLDGDDFTLVTKGNGTSTTDTVEIQFNETEAKRIKIKFVGAQSNWASMSEVAFYKKDIVRDTMENLFTDYNKNQVIEEYRDINKLNELEKLAKEHIFYNDYKNQIEDAKIIVENNKIISSEAKTKKFTHYNNSEYNKLFKMDNSNIESIKNNAGNHASQVIGNAIDGNLDTYWETNKGNSDSFNNEVEITFKDRVILDRVMYGARQHDTKGFAEEFEIYASSTSQGDTYQLVSKGSHKRVGGLVEAKFNPTEFKRIKFKFKKSNQNWATANEFVFYKEDKIANKIDRLFTDNTLSIVSEEYNTIEKINELESEVKNHPLYNDFKEDIENAKALISKGIIEASNAKVSTFNLADNEQYNSEFKMNNSNIKSIKNNGGHYSSQIIGNAIDGDLNTYWETNKSNSSSFNNEVEIEFNEDVILNRIVYGARLNDAKGFAEAFEIYASTTTKGDTYELVSVGEYNKTNDFIEAKFEPTKFKRVKFKFKKSNKNWATAREFIFYKEDKLSDEINNIFVDNTYSELKEEYKNIDKINKLQEQSMKHPLKDELIKSLDLAKNILDGNVDFSKTTIVANQHGDMKTHSINNLQLNSFGQNLQATGLYALPGDKITVYLDVDDDTIKMPVLQFTQNEGSWRGWRKGITLHPGKNEIIVPSSYNESIMPTKPKPGGAILIENPYTPKEQGKAPTIRIEGAQRFPFFKEGDNEDEFKKFLIEYKKKLDEDNKTGDNKVLDILSVESDRMLISGTTTGGYNTYITKGINPSETTTFWDYTMEEIFKYYGLDGSSEIHDPKYIKEHIMFAQPHGYMYAWTDHVGVQSDVMSVMLNPEAIKDDPWGFIHETGHRMDTANRIWGEVTNNMLPMYMSHLYGKPDMRVEYNNIYKKAAPNEREDLYNNGRFFESLGMFWQLQLYSDSYWGQLNRLYRERKPSIADEQDKMDTLIEYSSEVFNRDLTEYFYRHGFRASEETKSKLSNKYQPLEKKVWYLNDSAFRYEGNGITKESKPKIDELDLDGNISISSDINKYDLLGYEIIRDGEIIGFTSNDTFKDETKEQGVEYKYQVVAYGKDLSISSISDETSSLTPNIKLQQTKTYIGLGEKFDALNYVKALTYNGEEITDKIKVINDVDTSKKGEYTVRYTVKDNNITTEKTMIVEVVSAIDYLSDKEWQSIETQYGTPRKNTNIKGRVNGDIKEFEKGIGIHANGKIEYKLEGSNYDNFEALLGVDMSIAIQNKSSVTFKIIGDGKILATTKVLKHADDMVHINVPIKGIKNLTIEIHDGGNGNSSDHTVMVNPKLTNNNAKPSLDINGNDIRVKLGTKIDLLKDISANDTEDGDLTSKIKVEGMENVNFNKTGEYKVTYKVTDSDNNTVSKEKIVSVIDMQDFKYLTEYDWKSATQSYSTTKKDTNVGGGTLKLTNKNNEEVSYKKGIGSHANATIIYDLSDKNYNSFTSFVGVDRAMYNSPGSVSFEVHVDGEKKFDSGLMQAQDVQKFVDVNINGAKELKLIVKDGGNGNASDHATWGNAKLHFVNKDGLEVNKSNLESLLEEVSNLKEEKYTKETWNNLIEVKTKVIESLKDGYNQAEIDSLYESLNNAKLGLEEDGIVTSLEIVSESNKKELYLLDESIKLSTNLKPATTSLKEVVWTAIDPNTKKESKAVSITKDGVVTPNSTGKVEVVEIVATSKHNEQATDSIQITSYASQLAQPNSYEDIKKENWTATTNAPLDNSYAPNKAIDGKIGGHDVFQSGSAEGPKYLEIDMKKEYSFNGFGYHNKTNGHSNEGKIKKYNLYISNDGKDFTKVIDNGLVPRADVKERKDILLDKSYTARYIRFECLETQFGDNKMAVLEFSPFTTQKNIPVERMEITSKEGTQDVYEINTVGEGIDLDVKIYPENATDKDVLWNVEDAKSGESIEKYVTIDENGLLKATGESYQNDITIKATSKINDEISAQARGLVMDNTNIDTTSIMKKFNLLNNENLPKYDEKYKAKIDSISNNGRHYSSSNIEKAIDGNVNTHWETGTPNNSTFKNEVILKMDNPNDVVDTLVYATRQDGSKGKGFPLEYEIHASNSNTGNTFRKIAEGEYTGNTSDFVEIKFTKTSANRFKLVFKNAKQDWASASEIWMYKEDTLRNVLDDLFVDSSKTVLKEEYRSKKCIDDLQEQIQNYELKNYYENDLKIARDLVDKKPELNIEEFVSTKIGEPIDILGQFSAIDFEDGDITSKVVITGEDKVNFNKTGEYKLTYTITDSDNNTLTKERTIAVVDMNDYKYLTEYDWKSAVQSYSTTKKDTNIDGNTLKLTDKNNKEVLYEKGIGSHANATIIYDLSDKNYEYFTSFVGVDRLMYNRQSSVLFEVYVDGEKKYDSGIMLSNDPQKFVEVNINGAKELKLVVKDGGNGNGQDHATWGDTKLHFANSERADLTGLKEAIKKAEAIDVSDYTEETINNLNSVVNKAKELLNSDLITQNDCDEAIRSIEDAIIKLEVLDKVIVIQDKGLEQDIKRTLNIGDRDITLRDMHKLVSLECISGLVKNLNGLEYAVNLENLNIDFNEVNDISAIKNLKNLKNFSGKENFISNSSDEVLIEDGKFIIEDVVIDADGERLLPTEVVLSPNTNPKKLDLSEVLVGNKVVIDTSLIEGTDAVEIIYESKNHDYQLYTFTFLYLK